MATKSNYYDHPTYITRQGDCQGEAGGAATTQYAKFCAFTAMTLFSAQFTVTVAGTSATNAFVLNKISGTATTALGTATFGTGAAGTTQNLLATNVAGGVALIQGDLITVTSGPDTAGKVAVTYEISTLPGASITV